MRLRIVEFDSEYPLLAHTRTWRGVPIGACKALQGGHDELYLGILARRYTNSFGCSPLSVFLPGLSAANILENSSL